jgi:hypothetical protein
VSLNPSDLTDAMQAAFTQEWQAVKGGLPPSVGTDDRRLLFAAVARGLLQYLEEHEDELVTRITFEDSGQDRQSHTVVETRLGINTD